MGAKMVKITIQFFAAPDQYLKSGKAIRPLPDFSPPKTLTKR